MTRPLPLTFRSFAYNVLSNWTAFLFAAVISFFLMPFVVRQLGDTRYGLWVLLGSIVGYLGLLDFGVRGAVTRYVAKFFAVQDHEAASRYVSIALRFFLVAGCLALAASGGAALLVDKIVGIQLTLLHEVRWVILISGATIAVSMVGGVFGGVVAGLERFDSLNAVEMVLESARAGAVVFFLSAGYGLIALATIFLVTALFRAAAHALLARRLYPRLAFRLDVWESADVRTILGFGATSALLQCAGILTASGQAILISAFLPVAFVTFFSIGASLTQYARSVVSGITQVMTPRASALKGLRVEDTLRHTVLAIGRSATLIVLPMSITFILRGRTFIELWMGAKYAESSGAVLWILAIALSFSAARQVVGAAMIGLNRHRTLVVALFVEGALNLGLGALLIQWWSIVGVAWGAAIPHLAFSLLFIPWYTARVLHISPRESVLQFWLTPLCAMVPFAACTFAVEHWWPAHNLLLFFLQVACVLPAAVVGALALGLTRTEREGLLSHLRTTLPAALR